MMTDKLKNLLRKTEKTAVANDVFAANGGPAANIYMALAFENWAMVDDLRKILYMPKLTWEDRDKMKRNYKRAARLAEKAEK